MTVSVPPEILYNNPFTSDPIKAEEFAMTLLKVSATFDDLDYLATQSIPEWHGRGANCYRERVREVSADAAAMSLALRSVGRAVQAFVDELSRLQIQYETLTYDISAYKDLRARLIEILATEPSEDNPDLQSWARESQKSYDNCIADIQKLESGIKANEDLLRPKLVMHTDLKAARLNLSLGYDDADNMMMWPGAPGNCPSFGLCPTPEDVAQWWDRLTEDQRVAVIAAYPEVIGATDGLPAEARNEANRILLGNDIAALDAAEERGWLTDSEAAIEKNVRAAQEALAEADDTFDPITDELVPAFLHLYQPAAFDNDGAIAIAIGDPDTADNVTTFVPGINTDGTSAMNYTEGAQNIYESARLSDRSETTAALMWIGYDAPSGSDISNTPTEFAAAAGGDRLADYVDGLRASRGEDQPHMTVIGHSYGSTTMAHAATDDGLDVDDLIFLGSPGAGSGVDNVDDLGGPTIWVGNASRDGVAALADDGSFGTGSLGLPNFPWSPGLGNDVAEDTFGAYRFQAESENRGTDINFGYDHIAYLERGTESIFSIGQIVVGDNGEVLLASPVHDPWYWTPIDPEFYRTPTPSEIDRAPDD